MTLDDIHRLCCRPEGPPDAIYLPRADIDALLLEAWDMMWPKPPSPPTYKPGEALTAHGIPIGLAEVAPSSESIIREAYERVSL